ncbi:helix-turn-helix domain-containing protein [Microbacterium bandirmense]|uniref:helix-turn-helix domain-containing protein n=1 Tax=Microbacterium bandirmense TaxID=3122050 RepID=UPI003B28558B
MTELGDRIARLRGDLGLTQQQAAERSALTATAWSRIESGETEPHLSEVLGIAAALGCFVSTILCRGEILDRLQSISHAGQPSADLCVTHEDLGFYLEAKARLRDAGHDG